MNLKHLFSIVPDATITGSLKKPLSLLTDDSRKVIPGSCYVAVRGTQFDGHTAISAAIAAGATAIVAETPVTDEAKAKDVMWIQTPDTHLADGMLMSAWNAFPSQSMVMLGVTGTNGKTTISYLTNAIFRATWQRAGLIGTIVYDDGAKRVPSHNTTPGCAELQTMLAGMVKNGCRAVAMEVSSHALHQQRTAGTEFRVGIFTNLTQDHLDYHGDMESYYQAKKLLFTSMAANKDNKAVAVINADDYYGKSGFSGEIGHFPLLSNDIICRCGKVGCLETGASGSALHRMIVDKLKQGRKSSLSKSFEKKGEIELEEILQAIREEDVLAIEGIGEIGETLGRGIAGIINIFNPGLVIVGGRLIVGGDYLMYPIKTAVNKLSLNRVSSDTTIQFSKLGRKAASIGDCLLSRSKLLGLPL